MATKQYIKNQSVSFNTQDPDQLELMKHANKRKNFSAYVKRLIQRDMEGGSVSQLLSSSSPIAVLEKERQEEIEVVSIITPPIHVRKEKIDKNNFTGII